MDLMQMEIMKATEAEMSVLGALMLHSDNQEIYTTVMESLHDPDFFGVLAHRHIFGAILSLYNQGMPADLVSVKQQLVENNLCEEVGGFNYLSQLFEIPTMPSLVPNHIQIILKAAVRRKTALFASKLLNACNKPGQDIDNILLTAEKGLVNISNLYRGDDTVHISEVLPEVLNDFEKSRVDRITGLATGYGDLDEKTGGFHPGELIILAARPSVGKSALALNIAENLIKRGIPVGLISLEMTRLENAKRLVLSRARTPLPNKLSLIKDEDWKKIDNTIRELKTAPLYINDQTDINITKLKSLATKLRLNHNVELLIIDYLQLLSSGKSYSTQNEEVSIISRALKILAGNLHIPILTLSQLSRAIEHRGPKSKPRLSDLRDSGALEQDADLVMFLHPTSKSKNEAELIIAKQRNGPRGIINLHFMDKIVRWELGARGR